MGQVHYGRSIRSQEDPKSNNDDQESYQNSKFMYVCVYANMFLEKEII